MKIKQFANYAWTKWFAWFPVRTTNDGVVWLEAVERKLESAKIPNVFPSTWTIYRRILKDKQ